MGFALSSDAAYLPDAMKITNDIHTFLPETAPAASVLSCRQTPLVNEREVYGHALARRCVR